MVICPLFPRFLKNFSFCLCFSYVIVMSVGTNSFLNLFCLGFLGLLEPVTCCLSLILESSQPLFSYCFCPIFFLLSGISISYVFGIYVSQPLVFFQIFISQLYLKYFILICFSHFACVYLLLNSFIEFLFSVVQSLQF